MVAALAAPAQDGLDAMDLQGLTVSIDNTDGEIFGGGGGAAISESPASSAARRECLTPAPVERRSISTAEL